jgi:hypothetical protein
MSFDKDAKQLNGENDSLFSKTEHPHAQEVSPLLYTM